MSWNIVFAKYALVDTPLRIVEFFFANFIY